MPTLQASELRGRDTYALLTTTVVPRPIAWVTSRDADGVVNCAPFSFFNGVSGNPPMVSVAVSKRREKKPDGSVSWRPKDTWANVEATEEYVIHVVDEHHAHVMVETSGDYPPEESEVEMLGLKTEPSEHVSVPRLVDAPVAMECRLVDVYEPPRAKVGLLIGEVLCWHLKEGLVKETPGGSPAVDVHKLMPLARLGGLQYCPVRDVFEMDRPQV